MLSLNRLNPAHLYRFRDTIEMPYNTNNSLKGYMLAVYSDSLESTVEFFKRPNISIRKYGRYYIERRLFANFSGDMVRKLNKQKEIFDDNFGKAFPKFKLITDPKFASNNNIICELGQYNELLNSSSRVNARSISARSAIKLDKVFEHLRNLNEDFPTYKKALIIPIDQYLQNPASLSVWTNKSLLDNFVVMMIREFKNNPLRFKNELPGWKIIFVNNNELFYYNCDEIPSDDLTEFGNKVKNIFIKLRSSKNNKCVDNCDDEDLTDDEDKNDEIINKENEEKVSEIKKTISDGLNSLGISDNTKNMILNVTNDITNNAIRNSTQPLVTNPISQVVKNKDDKISSKLITKPEEVTTEPQRDSIVKKIDADTLNLDIKNAVSAKLSSSAAPKSSARIARNKSNAANVKNVKANENETIADLAKKAEEKHVPDKYIKSSVINPKMKNIQFSNFEKGYNENLFEYDFMNILASFSEKDRPLYLIKYSHEDTSTVHDKIITHHCTYEDERGERHSFSFMMPKFMENGFMFLNGSDKIFLKQIVPLPISKVNDDQVQVSSSYNKIFMTRFGRNVSTKVNKFIKIMSGLESNNIEVIKGNNIIENSEFNTSMEYDELAKQFMTITVKNLDLTFYFNQKEIREECAQQNLTFDDSIEFPFAIKDSENGKQLFVISLDNGSVLPNNTEEDISPIDFILSAIDDPDIANQFEKTKGNKKTMYTRGKIMGKDVPIVLLLSYLIGLDPLLNKLNCNHKFSETHLQEDSTKRGTIQFKDGFLSFDLNPYANSLLLNGLTSIPTEEYNFMEFSSKEIYYDIFQTMFGRRNIANAFDNFMQLFIDPITKDVLQDHKLPTNFIDLLIHANKLLADNSRDRDGDLKNFRIRSNEMLNVHLFKVLSKAYEGYHMTADDKNPKKFGIKPNAVINDLYSSQVLEEFSNLNPILEADRMRSTSYKGPGGCNLDDGFRMEKRAFNDSMIGILAQSSPISGSVGIARVLALNPNVVSLRGYLEPGDPNNLDNANETNMLSIAEMLVPMAATHDDPQRVGMTSTQSRHTIATMESDVPLFGYGTDKILAKLISDKFAFKAKEDGVIIEGNDELGYQIVKYKSGKTEVIDLTNRQALNTGSGFYINNKLDPLFEVGHKFKEGDVLAINKQFFTYDELSGDVIYKSGPLARVALVHASFVYEDSTSVTESFAKKLASYIDELKDVRLGSNANVYKIAKVGDMVKVNDPLIVFDESYTDPYLNDLLAKMTEEDRNAMIESNKQIVKSKWNGEVIDVKIYYICPKNELSESLQAVLNEYEKVIKERRKAFENAGVDMKNMTTLNDIDTMTVPVNGKIGGTKMDDNKVLIKFFIRKVDNFALGDKITYSCALKGINQSLIPMGEEPYLASDPNTKIDAFLSISGFYARMTNSAGISLALNSVLLGAEKKIKDILEDKI